MLRTTAFSLLTLGIACATVAILPAPPSVAASGGAVDPLLDSDGDFLPDVVEWAVLTSASCADTDNDQSSDFVEVVQRGLPRTAGVPIPTDQEMRIVVAGPPAGSGNGVAWLHLLVRIVGPASAMTSFQAWFEMPAFPGERFSFDLLALGPSVFRSRDAGAEGQWLTVSVPLAPTALLQLVAPISLHVESMIAGRQLRSASKVIDVQGELVTLVPFNDVGYALHGIVPNSATGTQLSNRVCVLELTEVGSGPGGTVFQVDDAGCEDCNEVECSATCPDSVGWLLTIPGGLQVLSAGG
jgi:hypothetical protein